VDLAAKVLVVSDSVHAGLADDVSGPMLTEALDAAGFHIVELAVCPDGVGPVTRALRRLCHEYAGLVVTSGGTGFAQRDLTPEATRGVLERQAPALAEAMHRVSPLGRLSRGIAGTTGSCLLVNLPGSPRGAAECLEGILDVIPHALELLGGEDAHPHESLRHGPLT
jgi:molybdenum cofactor synthesis domain-containing protein